MHPVLKTRIAGWSATIIATSHAIAAVSAVTPPPGHAAELLVKCSDGPDSAAAHQADAAANATVVRRFRTIGWHHVRLPGGVSAAEGIARYRAQPGVLDVEPNQAGRRMIGPVPGAAGSPSNPPDRQGQPGLLSKSAEPVTPDDPRYKSQWNLRKISMEAAWATSTGESEVVVAVIDTGVDYTHPDLAANMWVNAGESGRDAEGRDKAMNGIDDDDNGYVDDVYGYDFDRNTSDPMDRGFYRSRSGSTEPIYHGTTCAGLFGAVRNNGTGFSGMGSKLRIMALLDFSGDEDVPWRATVANDIAAFDYVVMMKRRGVNIRSTNNSYSYTVASRALADAIAATAAEGILNVFAAGNASENNDVTGWRLHTYDFPNILAVAATDSSDALATFSNVGRSTVDIAAPGVDLPILTKGGYLERGSGTSYSCPQVAGAAALLWSIRPELTLDEVKAALLGSADHPASLRTAIRSGGRLNVAGAVNWVSGTTQPAIVTYSAPASQLASPEAPIQMRFSRAMNPTSVEAAFQINPAVNGTFVWSDDRKNLEFRHADAFAATKHTVTLLSSALDADGGTLDGNFNRVTEGSPADNYVWVFDFQLPNDDLAKAQAIFGDEGSIKGNNTRATQELEEPEELGGLDFEASLWYRWIAPATGWYTFDLTSTAAIDSVIGIFEESTYPLVRRVAENRNYGSKLQARTSFEAVAGNTYSILVGGDILQNANPTLGSFTLRWYPTPAPVIANPSLTSGASGQVITLSGTNLTGVTRVTIDGHPVAFGAVTNVDFVDLRLLITLPIEPRSGLISLETPHGSSTSTKSFTVVGIPSLTIEATADRSRIISWPSEAEGFVLQGSDRAGAGAVWRVLELEPAPLPPFPGRKQVIDPQTTTNRFYRLRHP